MYIYVTDSVIIVTIIIINNWYKYFLLRKFLLQYRFFSVTRYNVKDLHHYLVCVVDLETIFHANFLDVNDLSPYQISCASSNGLFVTVIKSKSKFTFLQSPYYFKFWVGGELKNCTFQNHTTIHHFRVPKFYRPVHRAWCYYWLGKTERYKVGMA
jgi:hypothetical protein